MAYHVRRRLTAEEAGQVGGVLDLRGTAEGRARFDQVRCYLPLPALRFAALEVEGR